MKNLWIILLIILLSPQMVKAQISFDPGEGCLNIVDFSARKGLGDSGSNSISAHYVHERLINEQFNVGLGVGYAHLNKYQFSAYTLGLLFEDRHFGRYIGFFGNVSHRVR